MRSVVKHSYLKTASRGRARAKAHVKYIQFRGGKDKDHEPRKFFSQDEEGLSGRRVIAAIDRQDHRQVVMHKLIISPGVQGADVQEYTREVMSKLSSHKGLDLEWYGVVHENTQNPHCHVVVMAKDKNGWQVRIAKDDYGPIKQAGDDYLIRNKLWSKDLEKEKEPGKNKDEQPAKQRAFGERLVAALKSAKRDYTRETTKVASREEERQARVSHEEASLGKAPTFEQLSISREEAERKHKETVWKAYSKPISVKIGRSTKKYNWTDSLQDLRSLEGQVNSLAEVRDQLSEVDVARLDRWIKDSYAEQQVLIRQAEKVEKVAVKISEETSFVLSGKSSLEDIRHVQKLQGRGEIALPAHELLAIQKWEDLANYREPIFVEVPGAPGPVMYDKEDMIEALKFLATEYEGKSTWARKSLTRDSYRKLKSWIDDKEKETTQEAQKTQPEEPTQNSSKEKDGK